MKLFYLANIRVPTEKAHGLQIVQMCEAFAQAGAEVTLIVPRRINTEALSRIDDVWAHYGVRRNFAIRRIPCIDIYRWLPQKHHAIAFWIQTVSYMLALLCRLLFQHADIYYSRDLHTLLALSLLKPRRSLVYEAHQNARSNLNQRLQDACVRRVTLTVAVTGRLAEDLQKRGALRTLVAHDGIRLERFAEMPDQKTARAQLGVPANAYVVGYVGQLHTMMMSKGIDVLIDAIAQIPSIPVSLCLIGGPATMADSLRQHWKGCGLPDDRFLYLGQMLPSQIPAGLATFDVCTMPFPWTEHFAYYASPLKLFEYMAAGRAIISSDLPSAAEVIRDEQTALLVPPGDVQALAETIQRLYQDAGLRERLAHAAEAESVRYSWQARAKQILQTAGRA